MGQILTASLSSVQAYPAERFRVEYGANMGDPLGVLEDLVLDDIYLLNNPVPPQRLGIATHHDGSFRIAGDTALGTPGAALHLDCLLTLMPDSGPNTEILVMVEVDGDGLIAGIFLVPLAPLQAHMPYTLVKAGRKSARRKLAQSACVSFTRGTRITLATGAQRLIEDMRAGDRVLTRDDGIQEVRWVGQSTLRAVGDLAPILIRQGALNNANDLIVSPAHRLMVYQRSDEIGAGAPEVLVRARDLVNGGTVVVLDGGFADYFQILFDRHHIIYAEGIAAESTFLDPVTSPALPDDFWTLRPGTLPAQHKRGAHGLDVSRSLLDRPDAVGLLKRASLR
ncbi:Hint domain-containing protein [Leisingera sp. M527]|uniref:Hint domain-containing protein n=1 Tax=unclassified Leisingera TaxID=2614906 RepID=UPI0021A28AAC|nr:MULTISPECIES: Hint domain-containing protein [unclassified Leisingera]UWQ31461.1 Hint domain-containing protein [Leisingera sp. M527]UWQ73454.1 Hint domain-containing protein [Leisingera sp. M658]